MLKPVNHYLLCELPTPEEVTEAGIHIPKSAQQASTIAVVLDVAEDVSLSINKGDRIMFQAAGNVLVEDDDRRKVVLIHEEDVLGIHR